MLFSSCFPRRTKLQSIMTDVQYWDATLSNEIEEIQSIVSSLSNKTIEQGLSNAISNADKKVKFANGTKRSLKMEIRILSDMHQKERYENNLSRHEDKLAKLTIDIKVAKSGTERKQLFLGVHTNSGKDDTDGDALIKNMDQIQDKTQTSLDRTTKLISGAKETGTGTLEELGKQSQRIESINMDMDRIEDELTRADRLIKTFAKRMATDKVFQCFAFVNVLIMIFVAVYAITGGFNGKGKKEAEETVDEPERYLRSALIGLIGNDNFDDDTPY